MSLKMMELRSLTIYNCPYFLDDVHCQMVYQSFGILSIHLPLQWNT